MASFSANTIPPLLRLPVELHLHITSYLEIDDSRKDEEISDIDLDLLNFRLTSKYFHSLIPAPTLWFLLHLERRPGSRLGYACVYCVRLRPARKFADNMFTRKRGRSGQQAFRRFCADCGFDVEEEGRYAPGTRVVVDGVSWVYCLCCRRVKSGREAGPYTCNGKYCLDCQNLLEAEKARELEQVCGGPKSS
jgi:hypothetical protein